jgi:hypothetical protein
VFIIFFVYSKNIEHKENKNSLSSWQIHHISRIFNKVAHGLAQATVRQFTDQVWMEEILEYICDIVLLHQSALFL